MQSHSRDVVPEILRGEFVADHHRAAVDQQRAGRHHAADRVIHRQAIVHAVVGAGIHQPGKPEAPLQQPAVADIGRLRQAGRARRVDQERAIGDGHAAALGCGQRRPPDSSSIVAIDAGEPAVAVAPCDQIFGRLESCAAADWNARSVRRRR